MVGQSCRSAFGLPQNLTFVRLGSSLNSGSISPTIPSHKLPRMCRAQFSLWIAGSNDGSTAVILYRDSHQAQSRDLNSSKPLSRCLHMIKASFEFSEARTE